MRTANVQIEGGPQVRCDVPEGVTIHMGDHCIFKNGNIEEYGEVLSLGEDRRDASAGVDERRPHVLRQATLQDQAHASETAVRSRMAGHTCEEKIKKYDLKMRVVSVRFSYDRKILDVVFTSPDHVDFRELVRDLAGELRTHVEMTQIGVRDEAAIIGGMGPCGQMQCCSRWLKHFQSVNVRMAKAQRLSLNPTAISGNCGRLKCCLHYEYEQYRELGRGMPRIGDSVSTEEGDGRVIGQQILAQRLKVRLDDDRIVDCAACDCRRCRGPRRKERRHRDESSGDERTES